MGWQVDGEIVSTDTEYTFELNDENAKYLGNEDNQYFVLYQAKNTQITGCNISSNCKFIYDKAFLGCSGLTSITIPTGIISIGDSAFNGCSSLAVITYGDNSQLTRIGEETFKGCSNLTTVTIESAGVYTAVTSTSKAGYLLNKATTVNVLASVDENNTNTFLNNATKYSKSEKHQLEENGEYYYTYTKL